MELEDEHELRAQEMEVDAEATLHRLDINKTDRNKLTQRLGCNAYVEYVGVIHLPALEKLFKAGLKLNLGLIVGFEHWAHRRVSQVLSKAINQKIVELIIQLVGPRAKCPKSLLTTLENRLHNVMSILQFTNMELDSAQFMRILVSAKHLSVIKFIR